MFAVGAVDVAATMIVIMIVSAALVIASGGFLFVLAVVMGLGGLYQMVMDGL